MTQSDILIVGGGPAGMMAGLLFARAGLKTVVLEKHGDFLRDFRGDTVHPSTLTLFHELGLLESLLARPHDRVTRIGARIGGEMLSLVDFAYLPVPAPFIALMPQWEFLDFVAGQARLYPHFTLHQSCEATSLIEDGRVAGVQTADGCAFPARLTIIADGRDSRFSTGFARETVGAPMDIFWFRVPKTVMPDNESTGLFDSGRILVLIDRGNYWQCAFAFAKGTADIIRMAGLPAFLDRVRSAGPEMAAVGASISSWDDVKLLTVTVDRLKRWHRPGLLVIGDAAHAMSPIGGIGINLAIQDAVAAANMLAAPMAAGHDPDPLLHRIEARRQLPTRVTQAIQAAIQSRVIAPLLDDEATLDRPPCAARLIDRFPVLRRLPARAIGLGVRPEHVRSPQA